MKKKSFFKKLFTASVFCIFSGVLFASSEIYSTYAKYTASKEYKDMVASGKKATWNDIVDEMDKVLDNGKELYKNGDAKAAYNSINNGYYGWYETTGFERIAMGKISGSRKTEMELQFASCKAVTKKNGSLEEFSVEVEKLKKMLREDANILDGRTGDKKSAALVTFLACFGIILREGFEAILIVGAIIAYLVKSSASDEKKKKKLVFPVYAGSVIGVAASFALAGLLYALRLANSASQEIIEGITALTAVCVLYYVSNWMLSKSESEAWTSYIKTKTQKSSEKGSVYALAVTAFLAVFREGAEVVLFYQPMLNKDNNGGALNMVWLGFALGLVCLVVVYLLIRIVSLRIPLKPFFTATSILMFIMSISFLGAGIKELIEGDLITATSPTPAWCSWLPSNDLMDILGIYAEPKTLVPQILLLLITVFVFVFTVKKNKKLKANMEESAEEK